MTVSASSSVPSSGEGDVSASGQGVSVGSTSADRIPPQQRRMSSANSMPVHSEGLLTQHHNSNSAHNVDRKQSTSDSGVGSVESDGTNADSAHPLSAHSSQGETQQSRPTSNMADSDRTSAPSDRWKEGGGRGGVMEKDASEFSSVEARLEFLCM
ncbi:hypothetical protein Tcan_13219 [Toxocara canis]|uniref:Uncharacterized protein n=1 Tax=Toxocara canis TaxID=6265 RepID=A0A0B2W2Q7_TOXCA|nr:hypothetical protein Tcan_13219 [Toxocara canis]